jgi:hypothetical protein
MPAGDPAGYLPRVKRARKSGASAYASRRARPDSVSSEKLGPPSPPKLGPPSPPKFARKMLPKMKSRALNPRFRGRDV